MAKKEKIVVAESLHFLSSLLLAGKKRLYFLMFNFGLPIAITLIFPILYPGVVSAETCEQWIAKAVSVEGRVEVRRTGDNQWQAVQANETFCPGDTIRVLENSRADVTLVNQPLLRLDQNTTITLGGQKEDGASLAELVKGAAHFFSRLPRNLEVRTAFVNAGVEGTEFFVKVDDEKTFVSVFEGKVLAANEAGNIPLVSGQSAVAEKGKAPVYQTVVRPRDAVLWALYYPPVFYTRGKAEAGGSSPDSVLNKAAELLSVGRVDEANANINQALSLAPGNSNAFSLQSIIAVVQNEKEQALELAEKATNADPGSATAQIALSYAQQADFNLEAARASLEKAVELEPDNALAWARLAELWSSFGDLDKALATARKAVELDPNLSRTQTVLGFAYLTQVKTAEAKAAFEKAIALDQADSLPRLGLGLARIRDGELEEGRGEIEIAASLNANSSIIRSYLGKAYYEEKRSDLDSREYAIAKELDPKDPTPWFYDAIQKQTTNRPVEALHEYEHAIKLNDNRAVYRSKLLLDSDEAARQSALARVYSDLGFQQLALVEGWKSLSTDPTNYSAHRFLSDSYSVRPRHEIARVSELLQSQLLQPINITPIQPQLAESNLFLLNAQGPSAAGFNTYNPLFNRNQATAQLSGLVGSNETWGGEGVVSAIYDKLSLSAGYTNFKTDGWRENSDLEDKMANFFAQYEISYKTSVQAEYRYRDNERGDIRQRFFEEDYLLDLRSETDVWSGRLGLRHNFSPGSILLGNFQYGDGDDGFNDLFFFDPAEFGLPAPDVEDLFIVKDKQDVYGYELSHLWRKNFLDLVSGAGYFKIDQEVTFADIITWPGVDPPELLDSFSDTLDYDTDHFNLYAYANVKPFENLILTLGASGDIYDQKDKTFGDENIDESQFNPKFGVTWNPLVGTTLRGSVFRTFKRTLVTDQTLEPTQVAGFNQFYDDPDATDAWVLGGAVDQKLRKDVYLGGEMIYRDLDVPYFGQAGPGAPISLEVANWEEYMGRLYAYWTPCTWVALRAEYQYEKYERDEELTEGIVELETHRVPLGVSFFHPSGFSVGLKATYYNTEGTIERTVIGFGVFEEGEDDFWLVDSAINYRLPKRYGFISLGVTNLFDENFNYYDIDPDNPSIIQDQQVFVKLTLALP